MCQLMNKKGLFLLDMGLIESKNLSDLREIAKLAGIKSVTKYKKAELISMLMDLENKNEQSRRSEDGTAAAVGSGLADDWRNIQAAEPS